MKKQYLQFFLGSLFFLYSCASSSVKEDYKMRAPNFDGKKFHNESEYTLMQKVPKNTPTGVLSKKGTIPIDKLPLCVSDFNVDSSRGDVYFTWFGHSTLLIQMNGKNILFDPVFSKRTSPVSFIGPKRFTNAPCKIEDLPDIDILIITHNHYDHLDKASVKKLASKVTHVVTPLGVEKHLIKFGIKKEKITNMAWWEEINIDGITIGCTPARHFSGRMLIDSFNTLWASWVLKDGQHKIFHCADSGWDTHFERIQKKYGNFDLAFIEAGQYDPRWPSTHMAPEQSYEAAKALGTSLAVPVHWGTFKLAAHPWDDSVVRLLKCSSDDNNKIKIITPRIGQTVQLSKILDYQERWFNDIK